MEAPSLDEGNLFTRAARRYYGLHVAKPIRPQGRRFIYRMLVAGAMMVVIGLMLACLAIVFAASFEDGFDVQLLKIGVSLVFIGVSVFAMGHAYRRRGYDAMLSKEWREELASIMLVSEAAAVGGILIGLWSGFLI